MVQLSLKELFGLNQVKGYKQQVTVQPLKKTTQYRILYIWAWNNKTHNFFYSIYRLLYSQNPHNFVSYIIAQG